MTSSSVDDSIRRIWPAQSGQSGPAQSGQSAAVQSADLSDDELVASLISDEPTLRVNFVASIDGAVTHDGRSGGLSDAADKRHFELLRRVCDVVLVGAGTVRDEGYTAMRVSEESAAWRVANGRPEHPVFAIVSGSLALDPASPIFTDAPVRPVLFTTEVGRPRSALFDGLADVVVVGEASVEGSGMVAALHERGLLNILCEGGPALFGSLLAADVVDELFLTVSPTLEAGDARRITAGELTASVPLTLASVLSSGSTLLLRYDLPRLTFPTQQSRDLAVVAATGAK